jgi:hypothetical protein
MDKILYILCFRIFTVEGLIFANLCLVCSVVFYCAMVSVNIEAGGC